MWVRRSAIRPIPRHARVPQSTLSSVEASFSAADERARQAAQAGLERLRSEQPALYDYLRAQLPESLDETALALGHMLVVSVFLAFASFAGDALQRLSVDAVAAADLALETDEDLRRSDPQDPLDSEDIIAVEQPALIAFINEHIERTLHRHAGSVDVDDVAMVFRTILVVIVALSHAVAPPPGYPVGFGQEPMA